MLNAKRRLFQTVYCPEGPWNCRLVPGSLLERADGPDNSFSSVVCVALASFLAVQVFEATLSSTVLVHVVQSEGLPHCITVQPYT